MQARHTSYYGPNQFASHAAIVVEIPHVNRGTIAGSRMLELLKNAFPGLPLADLSRDGKGITFEQALVVILKVLYRLSGTDCPAIETQRATEDDIRLIVGFLDPKVTAKACQSALELTEQLYSAVAVRQTTGIDAKKAHRAAKFIRQFSPTHIDCVLIRAAQQLGIPVYPHVSEARVWLYGQGAASVSFFQAANDSDAWIGVRLAQNKTYTTQLVRRLGYPATDQVLAQSRMDALLAARSLGFPLAVKPVSMGQGVGVSTDVRHEMELDAAIAKVAPHANSGIIVERFVHGHDHRIALFGGKLRWVVKRMPAHVIGDGKRTVSELIEDENLRRTEAGEKNNLKKLVVDDEVNALLAKQHLGLPDIPALEQVVRLRSVATLPLGGTFEDCTDRLHPDNREMAETIAKAFRLDAVGIDFITPDVSKSWRDVECAVIEVNKTPAVFLDEHAKIVMESIFQAGCDGRVPTIVLVDGDASDFEQVSAVAQRFAHRLGRTTGHETIVGEFSRCRVADSLPDRVQAIILDPLCDGIVISVSTRDIKQFGLPLDRCDLYLIYGHHGKDEILDALVRNHSKTVLEIDKDRVSITEIRDAVSACFGGATSNSIAMPSAN